MDVITKNIARGFIATIGPEKIGNMATELMNGLIQQKKNIPLEPGEIDIVGLVYEINGVAHFAQIAIKDNEEGKTEITRYLSIDRINNLIQTLLENI